MKIPMDVLTRTYQRIERTDSIDQLEALRPTIKRLPPEEREGLIFAYWARMAELRPATQDGMP